MCYSYKTGTFVNPLLVRRNTLVSVNREIRHKNKVRTNTNRAETQRTNQMAIKIGRAAKLTTDSDGYTVGTLNSVDIKEQVDSKGKVSQQIEWIFKVTTTQGKSADKYMWTGIKINSERTYYPTNHVTGEVNRQDPQYNKLTQFLLSIGVINEKQVLSDTEVDLDVESFIGKAFRFKVIPDQERPALGDIDISSIKIVEN